jgi:hypothetical protein
MRAHRLGNAAAITVLLASAAVDGAFAQGTAGVEGRAQGELGVQAKPVVSADEQMEQANVISRRATELAERLTRMLAEARREKDILRANCVNRKLTEVNANARNVEQRGKALKDAVAAGDEGRRNHEYTVLTVVSAKLDSLNQEASQCLGASVYEPGASQVITTVPNNVLVGIDPATVPTPPPPPPAVNVPPEISGTN